jgi:hypothetical protein
LFVYCINVTCSLFVGILPLGRHGDRQGMCMLTHEQIVMTVLKAATKFHWNTSHILVYMLMEEQQKKMI